MADNLSLISDDAFVMQERSIQVTDEKLNRLLSNTYETARKDARSFKLYNHYGLFFSFASSLFLTLLTSKFNDYKIIDSNSLTFIAWIVLAASVITGTVLAIIRASKQSNDEHSDRDTAVNNIIEKIVSDENKKKQE